MKAENALYLPRLKAGPENELTLPANAGVWDNPDQDMRASILAKALATQSAKEEKKPAAEETKPKTEDTEIHSIPDPWGRVLLFARGLYDGTHPMHARILGEWRGLLAILALREIRRFNALDAGQSVDLSNARQEGRGSFLRVLAELQPGPDDFIDLNTTFEKFNLLKVRQAPSEYAVFGMTSASTLVATGASYEGFFDPNDVPWFDGRYLTDPTPFLNKREKTALAEWLHLLRKKISGSQSKTTRLGDLLKLLESYANGLDAGAQKDPDDSILSTDSPLPLIGGIFRHLAGAHNSDIGGEITELEIVSRDKGPTGYVLINTGVRAVLSPDSGQLRAENEIVVYRNFTLESAKGIPEETGRTSGSFDGIPDGMKWCSANFFFEDTLFYDASNAKGGEFPGCFMAKTSNSSNPPQSQVREIVFPLTEDAITLFSGGELVENFSVEWHPDGSATCRLRFTVRTLVKGRQGNVEGARHTVTIEKNYTKSDTTDLQDNVRRLRIPPVCIWPDFSFQDEDQGQNSWTRYFLFEYWGGRDTNVFAVRPWGVNTEAHRMIALKDENSSDERFQIYPMKRFPEVLVCTMPSDPDRPRTKIGKPPQGLLFLKAPVPKLSNHARTATLGVDFGTTGTTIYRRIEGDNGPNATERVDFKSRLFQVTSLDIGQFSKLTRQYFIPQGNGAENARDSGRILSVYQVFPRNGKELYAADDAAAVRDGHVLFPAVGDATGFFVGEDSSIHSNMKWGSEHENTAAQGFLTQVCMEALAELVNEGVGKVKVRYSYPTAFHLRDKTRWAGNWKAILRNLQAGTSIAVEPAQDDRLCREAVAATLYFAVRRGLAIQQGAVTLDIGGGTTDVAVWNKDDNDKPSLLAHLSVLFAGNDIFLAPFREKPEILTMLAGNAPINRLNTVIGDAYTGLLNAIVAAHGDAMLATIAQKARIPVIEEFLKILEVGLCGIGFYSGLLVGKLVKDGSYVIKDGSSNNTPTIPIFIGGNGSKLFQWCGLGAFEAETAFYKSFAGSFLAGVGEAVPGLKANVEIHLSDDPKEEVAAGLVAPGTIVRIEDGFVEPMAGEAFKITGSDRPDREWSEPLTEADVASLRAQIDPALPVFARFLKSLDSELHFALSDREIETIGGRIQNTLNTIAHAITKPPEDSDRIKAEALLRRKPVFFEALSEFLQTRMLRLAQL